jgi:hypothetical protein
MIAVDIVSFGDPARDDDVRICLRHALYQILEQAFDDSSVAWQACLREDHGDGLLIVAPAGVPTAALIDPLVDRLRAGLRRHNRMSSEPAKIRLRMAIHAGHTYLDANGVTGHAVISLFRMLEAPAFKRIFAVRPADFGLIASDYIYDEVIRHGPGLIDPEMYHSITVRLKETHARAWVYFPSALSPARKSRPTRRILGTNREQTRDLRSPRCTAAQRAARGNCAHEV